MVQSETQNAAFRKQKRELGSSHQGLAVDCGGLPWSTHGVYHGRGSPFFPEFSVFFRNFLGGT